MDTIKQERQGAGRRKRVTKAGATKRPEEVGARAREGETREAAVARVSMSAELNAALSLVRLAAPHYSQGVAPMIAALEAQTAAAQSGDLATQEAALAAQVATLDALGHYLLRRGVANLDEGYLEAGDRLLKLALRAFAGCRANVETLTLVKNPATVAFVKQANIGHAVQVNNGTASSAPSHARGKAQESPTELLAAGDDGERLDRSAAAAAGAGDSSLAAVGAIDGAAHR